MGARGVLGRGDAPVVWWALEGAPLLEHVEVVKLRKTPSLVFVGIFSSCDGGLEWQRGWFCFESVPLGKQGYRLRLTKVRFGGRQTTAKISASTRSFSQNTWGHRADTPKVYLMFRLGQILLYISPWLRKVGALIASILYGRRGTIVQVIYPLSVRVRKNLTYCPNPNCNGTPYF